MWARIEVRKDNWLLVIGYWLLVIGYSNIPVTISARKGAKVVEVPGRIW